MNAPLEPAHSPFGGSVAARILRCPASVRLVEKVPAHLRKASAYADRGTALHAAMALLIENECSLAEIVGKKIDSYVITLDDVENALRPVLTYVETLLNHPGAEYYLEHRVVFPTVPGAFGTCDLLVRSGNTAYLIDYKFGSGVKVLALYPDGDEDIINGQLLFYAAAARHSIPKFFTGVDNFVLTIVQPQSIEAGAMAANTDHDRYSKALPELHALMVDPIGNRLRESVRRGGKNDDSTGACGRVDIDQKHREMVSSVAVTHAELDEFIAVYRGACEEALSPTPRLERGAHCRFCPARPICPAHTGPLLDLAQFMVPTPTAPPSKEAYLQLLANGLNLVDAVKDIGGALHDQAKQALHAGDAVPGYALSAGRAVRNWKNETTAAPDLLKLGLARDDVLVETLRSPKQVEIRAKARGVKVPKELIVSRPSGVSLVRAENARNPALGRDEIVRSFSELLKALQGGGQA